MVFYLKYRPQKFSDLDSANVRDTLSAVLSSKKSSFHAFLFTGPKGLGKTSTARIVAKFLNCENRKAEDLEPCNRCYQCKSITSGSNLDVLEIDAASNRGIDEIRSLRDQVKLSTAGGKFRVYIIDEVHMLTNEAFNALLKTLEEPPSHVVFILCTTEPQKVPATIASRCLNVQFRKATTDEIVHSLKRIVSGEKLNVEKEELEEMAKLSEGSFRDAAKTLQELSSKAGNKKITKEFVDKHLKLQIGGYLEGIRTDLLKKETKHALSLISEMEKEGMDFKFFMEQLIETLHTEMVLQIMSDKSGEFTVEELKKLVELLTKAHQEIKYAVLPQLPLELAIIEFTISNAQGPVSVLPPAGARSATASSNSLRPVGNPSTSPPLAGNKSSTFLDELIAKVNSQNHSVAGVLRGASLGEMNGGKVILEAKYKFHKEKLEEKKTLELLEKMAGEILGKNVTIEVTLKAGDSK